MGRFINDGEPEGRWGNALTEFHSMWNTIPHEEGLCQYRSRHLTTRRFQSERRIWKNACSQWWRRDALHHTVQPARTTERIIAIRRGRRQRAGGLIRRLNIMISLSMRRPRRRSIARYAAAPISVGDRPRVDPEWVTGLCSRRHVRHWIRPLRQGGATQAGQHMASGRDVRDPVPRRIVIDQLRSYPAAKG